MTLKENDFIGRYPKRSLLLYILIILKRLSRKLSLTVKYDSCVRKLFDSFPSIIVSIGCPNEISVRYQSSRNNPIEGRGRQVI